MWKTNWTHKTLTFLNTLQPIIWEKNSKFILLWNTDGRPWDNWNPVIMLENMKMTAQWQSKTPFLLNTMCVLKGRVEEPSKTKVLVINLNKYIYKIFWISILHYLINTNSKRIQDKIPKDSKYNPSPIAMTTNRKYSHLTCFNTDCNLKAETHFFKIKHSNKALASTTPYLNWQNECSTSRWATEQCTVGQ